MALSQPIQLTVTPGDRGLAITGAAGKLVVEWSNSGARLQVAPALDGPWQTIAGAVSPYTLPPTAPAQFLRLMLP